MGGMKNFGLPILLTIIALTQNAFAHGTLYFEFAPDISSPHPVALYATPAQPFYPPNDFVDGFDLWIDNDGSPGTATFELRNSANTLLAAKTITVPTIAPTFGGTRFHVDLGILIGVSNSSLYNLRIISSLPKFDLYKANLYQVLQHNAQYYSDYVVEPALLGTTAQGFAFKFALYEGKETYPPAISNVKVSILSYSSARLDWNANEPVDARIDALPEVFGPAISSAFSGAYTYCPIQGAATCSATITGLSPSTTYLYTLVVKDSWGNQTTTNGTFTTPAGPTPSPTAGAGQSPPASPPPTSTPSASPTATVTASPSPSPTANINNPTPSPTAGGGQSPTPGGTQQTPPPGNSTQSPTATPSGNQGGGTPVSINVVDSNESDSAYTPVLVIELNLPEGTSEPVTGYKIEIVSEETGEIEKELVVSGDTRKLLVEKLAPGRYRLRIFVLKNGFLEQLGEPIPFVISLTPPPKPFGIKSITITSSLVILAIGIIALVLSFIRKKSLRKFS